MSKQSEARKPDYNQSSMFWTPVRVQDEDPVVASHEGDDMLLVEMPHFEDFARQKTGDGLTRIPTGVHDFRRVRLSTLFAQLEGITLGVWYRVPRIRCCAFLYLDPMGNLQECDRCHNRGYVCPTCKGARMVKVYPDGPIRPQLACCPSCTWDCVYKPERERRAVEIWLARNYPDGVLAADSDVTSM